MERGNNNSISKLFTLEKTCVLNICIANFYSNSCEVLSIRIITLLFYFKHVIYGNYISIH